MTMQAARKMRVVWFGSREYLGLEKGEKPVHADGAPTIRDLAKWFGVSKQAVESVLANRSFREWGVHRRAGGPRLTAFEREWLIAMALDGVPKAYIANALNCSTSTVWRHIEAHERRTSQRVPRKKVAGSLAHRAAS